MALNDALDELLQDSRVTEDDWQGLADVLKLDGKFLRPKLPTDKEDRRKMVNRELRHSYGHTFMNTVRDGYDPDYIDIVKATAKKIKVNVRDHHTLEDMEDRIIVEVIDRLHEHIIREEGEEAWHRIEHEVDQEIQRLIAEDMLPPSVADELKRLRAGALMASLLAGRLAGFALYMVANQIFFAIARALGIRVGVAVVGPIIGKTLAFLLGPAGWAMAVLWFAYDLGNTSWRKIIPAVVIVIALRRRMQFSGDISAAV